MKHFIKFILGIVLSLSVVNGYGMERSCQPTVEVQTQTSTSMPKLKSIFDNEGAKWLADLATNQFMMDTNSIKLTPTQRKNFNCMAMDVYNEASGEDFMGKKLVASVVLVRAREQHKSVCSIIHQPHQFSWTNGKYGSQHFHQISNSVHNGHSDIYTTQAYRESIWVAFYTVVFNGTPVTSANYYHTKSIHTKWDKGMKIVARHGNHVFYYKKPNHQYNNQSTVDMNP